MRGYGPLFEFGSSPISPVGRSDLKGFNISCKKNKVQVSLNHDSVVKGGGLGGDVGFVPAREPSPHLVKELPGKFQAQHVPRIWACRQDNQFAIFECSSLCGCGPTF